MNKRIIVVGMIAITIITIGIVSSYGHFQKKPEKNTQIVDKIILAAYAGDTGALVYIAQEQGYFEDNDLDVTIKDYEAGKLAADALLAGEADISTSADFVFVSNSFNNEDLKVLGTVAAADTLELVARKDKGITNLNDLKEKKVGVTKKSTGEFFLGSFLTFHGLSLQDINVVDLKPSELIETILNGKIDAVFTWDPNIYYIKNNLEDIAISWPGQSGQNFYFILITKDNWIKNNTTAAKRFMKSLLLAEDYVRNNPEKAKEFVKNKFYYEPEYIKYIWPKHKFIVVLSQALLITMEDQARWRINNNLSTATEVPNYLDYIYFDALEAVEPDAVMIIR